MPGSPPTSPRFGFPRPADSDTAAFSAQVLGIADVLDLRAAMTWKYQAKSIAYTAVEGDFVYAAAGVTVTLPTATAGVAVAVQGDSSVTGASPATVLAAGAAQIRGVGLSATATSFPLGTPGASAVLVADGTNWHIVGGQQDSGWVALGLSSNIASGGMGASSRLQADTVRLKGTLTNNTGSTDTGTAATVASGSRPSVTLQFPIIVYTYTISTLILTSAGAISVESAWNNGLAIGLDGISYTLT